MQFKIILKQKKTKYNRIREMENRLTAVRGKRVVRLGEKGEEIKKKSQGTCIKDPWTKTMGRRIEL